jgi:DNA-binding NarL/FixJ family response regulator
MEGIAELLAERVRLVALAATGRALVDAVGRTAPDLVITDVNMPHGSGVDAMKSVRAAGARTPFLFLTMHAEGPLVASVMRAGASGYVLKSAAGEELLQAVDVVLAGGTYVTPKLGGKMLGRFSVQRYRLTPNQDQNPAPDRARGPDQADCSDACHVDANGRGASIHSLADF